MYGMAPTQFLFSHSPGKLEEFLTKLQSIGVPSKMSTDYPKSIGFGSSHARSFPAAMKYIGLLDSSGAATDKYTKGLRGGQQGRALVAEGIRSGYPTLFATYHDANTRSDGELSTFFKSHSNLDDEKVKLVVTTFKTLCKFGDFDGSGSGGGADDLDDDTDDTEDEIDQKLDQRKGRQGRKGGGGGTSSSVVINVNIALSVDATTDPTVYDAFFAAMAKHLNGLVGGS
jgi:hypothetical protein